MSRIPSLILGIETSCDETAVAVVHQGKTILSNVVASQNDLLEQYGGVFPELACRRHADILHPLIEQALKKASCKLSDIEGIAVAHTPGLVGALLIGTMTAKSLAYALNIPFIGVNHIEAHLYAALMSNENAPSFPAIGAVLSGGHTALLRMEAPLSYQLISSTIDDAVGEAFDKVARVLQLPFPGGPHIEKLAATKTHSCFTFKAGTVKDNPLAFSFSGLKTKALYTYRDHPENTADIAYAFQAAAIDDIVKKTLCAAEKTNASTLIFGGGVTANQALRKAFSKRTPKGIQTLWPAFDLSLDNAAMIAGLGYHLFSQKPEGDNYDLPTRPTNKVLSF